MKKDIKVTRIYKLCDPRISDTDSIESIKYIGITIQDLKQRLQKHITDSRKTNKKLTYRENWIKGLLKLNLRPTIHLIEEVTSLEKGYEAEICWIKYYNELGCRLTNLSEGGEGFTGKIRSLTSKRQNKKRNHVIATSKQIYQFNLSGSFVKRYDSFTQAAVENNVSAGNIHRFIKGNSAHVGGFLWSLTPILPKIKEDLSKKKVDQYNEFGIFIKSWDSILEAGIALNIKPNTISMAINNYLNRKSAGGFIWAFGGSKVYLSNVSQIRHTAGIDQFSTDNEFIKHWDTLKEVGKALNVSPSSIGDCARGIYKTTAGFVWRFTKTKY